MLLQTRRFLCICHMLDTYAPWTQSRYELTEWQGSIEQLLFFRQCFYEQHIHMFTYNIIWHLVMMLYVNKHIPLPNIWMFLNLWLSSFSQVLHVMCLLYSLSYFLWIDFIPCPFFFPFGLRHPRKGMDFIPCPCTHIIEFMILHCSASSQIKTELLPQFCIDCKVYRSDCIL